MGMEHLSQAVKDVTGQEAGTKILGTILNPEFQAKYNAWNDAGEKHRGYMSELSAKMDSEGKEPVPDESKLKVDHNGKAADGKYYAVLPYKNSEVHYFYYEVNQDEAQKYYNNRSNVNARYNELHTVETNLKKLNGIDEKISLTEIAIEADVLEYKANESAKASPEKDKEQALSGFVSAPLASMNAGKAESLSLS